MSRPVPRLADRLGLIVIADTQIALDRSLVEIVGAALQGGAPAVQLRAKRESAREVVEIARRLAPEVRTAGALFFINDRVDVALVAGADGAHLGDDDLPLDAAHRITPPGFLLGRSVDSVEEAVRAERQGADYVGAGPVYATKSKLDAGEVLSVDGISGIAAAVDIPVVGIGGIDVSSAGAVAAAGAAGIAVIRAVMVSDDPEGTTRMLLRQVAQGRRSS